MSHHAAFLDAIGQKFRIAESPLPTPGPDRIVVRNHAIALNPIDILQSTKGVYLKSFPVILGSDIAGTVTHIGSGVTRFKPGDRVVGHAWAFKTGTIEDGAFAEYTSVPAANVAAIPASLSFTDAAVLPMAIDTAVSGLFLEDGLALSWPHESASSPTSSKGTILVYGASSSVGSMAVQLATLAGYRVIGIASSKNFDLVRECGAVAVFDYNNPVTSLSNSDNKHEETIAQILTFLQESKAAGGGGGGRGRGGGDFIGIFDSIGTPSSHGFIVPLLERITSGGAKARYVTTKTTPDNLPAGVHTKRCFGIGEFSFPLWEEWVGGALESGVLKCLPPAMVVGKGLEALQGGLDVLAAGVSGRKVVVEM